MIGIDDYYKWTQIKWNINLSQDPPYCKAGEVWWTYLGLNVGREQNGSGEYYERPVLILKKFTHRTFLCLPLTTKSKVGLNYYCLNNGNYVILSQPRLIDSKRLRRRMASLSKKEFCFIKNEFKKLI